MYERCGRRYLLSQLFTSDLRDDLEYGSLLADNRSSMPDRICDCAVDLSFHDASVSVAGSKTCPFLIRSVISSPHFALLVCMLTERASTFFSLALIVSCDRMYRNRDCGFRRCEFSFKIHSNVLKHIEKQHLSIFRNVLFF